MDRRRLAASLAVVFVVVGASALFFWWVFSADIALESLLLRIVLTAFLVFLMIVIFRHFSLLWLAYLQQVGETVRSRAERATEEELPPVSVLVPAYDEAKVLDRALHSLLRLDYPAYEVVVVDDGSTDGTLEVARRWEGDHGEVTVRVVTKANGGKWTALNLGIEASRHPFLLCMDADSRLEPGSLRSAMVHFRDPDVGAVAGNVKIENRDRPLTWLQALEYVEGLNLPRRAQSFLAAVNIVPGPMGVFRRSAVEEVGRYEGDTFAEDADLSLKLISAGWKVLYEEDAVVWTQAPRGMLDLLQQRYRWTRGILQAVRKRKELFLRPFPDFPLWMSALQLGFEGFVWPALNVYAHLFFALVLLFYDAGAVILFWWILMLAMDVVVALVTVSMEEEDLRLVLAALPYRLFYLLWLDVAKVFATVDELLNLEMRWDKLQRMATEGEVEP